ncbi:uncharacterized protein LOC143369166 isoform X2 [Andrena cerasifolii]|uniref:uncharacterized protein LOC143369166 isoform X2 n=1 Tax=Andrena cerasifolii TaxID=2819439 RepID=UPI004037D084
MQEKFLQSSPIPIPVYQHPIELYHETGQKRKNQGVDFKNLILLTKNAMKAHRGQSKAPQQYPRYVLESRNRGSRSESEVLQWLDKSCPPKTKEFSATSSLVSELRNSRRDKETCKHHERSKPDVGTCAQGSHATSSSEREKSDTRSRRRLYRDVLANSAANQAILENVFEKRYDELEQQAMEQYRTSEESLALKYQELERQAMEQYRCSGSATEVGALTLSLDDKQTGGGSSKLSTEAKCLDGRKCSGFGRCSPANLDEKREDSFPQRQANHAQVDDKRGKSVSGQFLSDKNGRSTILSKSLTTLTQKVSYGSKNTSKGASGDKMDKSVSVRASSKRRLILVSPYEKESEAKLTRTTDLEEFYCIANKNIFGYYNNTKIGKIGGGDENITIIQSPRTEVWLSGFWTT